MELVQRLSLYFPIGNEGRGKSWWNLCCVKRWASGKKDWEEWQSGEFNGWGNKEDEEKMSIKNQSVENAVGEGNPVK